MNFEPFQRDGFQIFKNFLNAEQVAALRAAAFAALDPVLAPVEYEADTGYPGAPSDRSSVGGLTPRRLLTAYARDPLWRSLATNPELKILLTELLALAPLLQAQKEQQEQQEQQVQPVRPALSQSHHNCIMTKHPGYSSQTLWHQDIRYWAFTRPELISAWFALTEEHQKNGGLWLIPGSHKLTLTPERLDEQLFLRPDEPANAQLIESAESVALNPGDLLLFHCRTFHAASTNTTDQVKLSAVFTYHATHNPPVAGTRSALYPSVAL